MHCKILLYVFAIKFVVTEKQLFLETKSGPLKAILYSNGAFLWAFNFMGWW